MVTGLTVTFPALQDHTAAERLQDSSVALWNNHRQNVAGTSMTTLERSQLAAGAPPCVMHQVRISGGGSASEQALPQTILAAFVRDQVCSCFSFGVQLLHHAHHVSLSVNRMSRYASQRGCADKANTCCQTHIYIPSATRDPSSEVQPQSAPVCFVPTPTAVQLNKLFKAVDCNSIYQFNTTLPCISQLDAELCCHCHLEPEVGLWTAQVAPQDHPCWRQQPATCCTLHCIAPIWILGMA